MPEETLENPEGADKASPEPHEELDDAEKAEAHANEMANLAAEADADVKAAWAELVAEATRPAAR